MKYICPTAAILLLLITLTATTSAQQKRQTTPKPQPKVAQAPAPTFDTLVPAESYIIYGEVRGAGQLIRSSALNDLLDPVLKLAGPPKEFKAVVKWLNAHAEEVMTSRLLVATWPSNSAKDLPDALIAIEFASAEEATKFSGSLNEFLPKLLSPSQPDPLPSPDKSLNFLPEKKEPPTPRFHLKRFGSLVVPGSEALQEGAGLGVDGDEAAVDREGPQGRDDGRDPQDGHQQTVDEPEECTQEDGEQDDDARGREFEPFDRSLDVQISRLRKMIEPDPAQPRYIQTVWGVGYVFVPDGAS